MNIFDLQRTPRILRGEAAASIDPLLNRTVAVIGYGNQGRVHAQNLAESGVRVVVGIRNDSTSADTARADGFDPTTIQEATSFGDLVILALPDEAQPEVYTSQIAPNVKPGATLGFLHGFAIRYGLIRPTPNVGVVMIAPKGPGRTLRERFVQGTGLPCLFAMHQDSPAHDAESLALAWANGIGCARAGIIYTTFADETETDLFGEQAVLCGGMTQLILASFETLVRAGYPPKLAYLECCHEVKQIADLVYQRGLAGMMKAISNTAEFGAYKSGPVVVDEHVRKNMQQILESIRSGTFASELSADYAANFRWFNQQRETLARHPIENAGKAIRALMPWLDDSTGSTTA